MTTTIISFAVSFALSFALGFAFRRMVMAMQMPLLPRLPSPKARHSGRAVKPVHASKRSQLNRQRVEVARQMADEARLKACQRVAAARRMRITK